MEEPTFVTTFSEDIYKATGHRLLETFSEHQKEGQLVACHEGFKLTADDHRILEIDITNDAWLAGWDRLYKADCLASRDYWCKRAWQWFRKAVALRTALGLVKGQENANRGQFLVWLDCDVEFKKNLSAAAIGGLLGNHGILHLKGTRGWTEMGIVIYDLNHPKVRGFLQRFFALYDGGFKKLTRWDDCWLFDECARHSDNGLLKDIAPRQRTRVVDESPLGPYLLHKKGFHTRNKIR